MICAVSGFLSFLCCRVVKLMCDNATVVSQIKEEGGTKSFQLTHLTIRLLKSCKRMHIIFIPVHKLGIRIVQSWRFVVSRQDTANEMVNQPMASESSFQPMGNTMDRSFCNPCQQKLHHFAITISGSPNDLWRFIVITVVTAQNDLHLHNIQYMIPPVLVKIHLSHRLIVILIAPNQMTANSSCAAFRWRIWHTDLPDFSSTCMETLFQTQGCDEWVAGLMTTTFLSIIHQFIRKSQAVICTVFSLQESQHVQQQIYTV